MARELIRQGFKRVLIVSEAEGTGGAEGAMMRAGFEWYIMGNLIKFDRQGKVIQKIPANFSR